MDEPYSEVEVKPTSEALAAWSVRAYDRNVVGPCPRCQDPTEHEIREWAVGMDAGGPAFERTENMICQCDGVHKDGSVIKKGCGAKWSAYVQPGRRPQVIPASSDEAIAAAKQFATLGTPVDQVRASAEKWSAGITAILSLFGISGLVFSKDAIGSLSTSAQIVAGISAACALIAALFAVASIFRAAHGWPVARKVSGDKDLIQWAAERQNPEKPIKYLQWAVRSAIGAICLLAVSVGIAWFGPTSIFRSQIMVTSTDGTVTCGRIGDSTAPATLAVRLQNGNVSAIRVNDITAIKAVEKCI